MYVWLYYSILVSVIFPFLATAVMTHLSLERRFPVYVHIGFWAVGIVFVNLLCYHAVDNIYVLSPIIILGPIQPNCVEASTVICISFHIVTWAVISLLTYKGSWSSKLMVTFIYSLICVASVVAIDSIYAHFYGFEFPDLVFKPRTTLHIIATVTIYLPLILFLPSIMRNMILRTGGNMVKYLPIPIILFCVFFGSFYYSLYLNGIGLLDSYYTYLTLLLCCLSYILLIGSLSGSISVDRYRRELDAASVVQNSCLPDPEKLPDVPFADINVHLIPAKEVGGDFYDIHRGADGGLTFVVADVSDKGLPAALFMMKSKVLLDEAVESADSPSECLDRINKRLLSGNESFMFVSMILCMLSPSGLLKIACAGHPSPLLRHNGTVSEISVSRGPLLGLFEEKYADTVLQMSDGDSVLLFTDGATDAENRYGEMFGIKRLSDSFMISEGPDISGNVFRIIRKYSSSVDLSDDLTIMSVSYADRTDP